MFSLSVCWSKGGLGGLQKIISSLRSWTNMEIVYWVVVLLICLNVLIFYDEDC